LTWCDDFGSYRGGIYEHKSGSCGGYHYVVIIGWNDQDGCWIIKDDHGTDWGEDTYNITGQKGWGRIKYLDSAVTIQKEDAYFLEVGARDGLIDGADPDCAPGNAQPPSTQQPGSQQENPPSANQRPTNSQTPTQTGLDPSSPSIDQPTAITITGSCMTSPADSFPLWMMSLVILLAGKRRHRG